MKLYVWAEGCWLPLESPPIPAPTPSSEMSDLFTLPLLPSPETIPQDNLLHLPSKTGPLIGIVWRRGMQPICAILREISPMGLTSGVCVLPPKRRPESKIIVFFLSVWWHLEVLPPRFWFTQWDFLKEVLQDRSGSGGCLETHWGDSTHLPELLRRCWVYMEVEMREIWAEMPIGEWLVSKDEIV